MKLKGTHPCQAAEKADALYYENGVLTGWPQESALNAKILEIRAGATKIAVIIDFCPFCGKKL